MGESQSAVSFDVLNPGGRDAEQTFPNGAGTPEDAGHPPVNFHAYAACMSGGFFRDVRSLQGRKGTVLVLLRKSNLRRALEVLRVLREEGTTVFVSCKESGAHQIADMLGDVTRLELFRELCAASDGAISTTTGLVSLYRACGSPAVHFVPTPYPVECEAWNFGIPFAKRRGIFVGTREFGVPSRNHLAAVVLGDEISREFDCPLAVMNSEGRRGGMILKSLKKKNPLLFILEGPLEYAAYLRLISLHRIVWQLDSSHVPGQVAGDALLCRMPCVGGNGEIDRIAFGGSDATADATIRRARALLRDDREWQIAVDESQARAREFLSFSVGARRLSGLTAA